MSAPCVLVLAGLDPSGGAGLLADAEAIRSRGARPLCVPTALTVQTTRRARSSQPIAPTFILEAARALLEEEDVRAVKLGMLGTPQIARAVFDLVVELHDARPDLPVVLDPVLFASSGTPLFKGTPDDARAAYRPLLSHAIVTPNVSEAQVLVEWPAAEADPDACEQLARELIALGARAALVKGGHALGNESIDVLALPGEPGPQSLQLSSPRLDSSARGTGCRLASALAAELALGTDLVEATRRAKSSVYAYLQSNRPPSST